MGSHPYLRFLARVSARQPLLRPPPDATLAAVSPSDLLGYMPYTHPISGYRNRSFELRRLELHVVTPQALPASCQESVPAAAAVAASSGPAADTADTQLHAHAPVHHRTSNFPSPRRPRPPSTSTSPCSEPGAAAANAAHATSNITRGGHQAARPPHPHPCNRRQPDLQRHEQLSLEDIGSSAYAADGATDQQPLLPLPRPAAAAAAAVSSSSPAHSYLEVRYPFTALPWLWREYHRPGFPGLDPALLIEDFDTFAADVAARHVGHVPDSMLVTAFLERFTWHLQLRPGDGLTPAGGAAGGDSVNGGNSGGGGDWRRLVPLAPTDMRLAGQVTWVGRSSMEVLLQLTTTEAPTAIPAATDGCAADTGNPSLPAAATASTAPQTAAPPPPLVVLPPGRLVATAEFIMALRDTSLKRAVDVPPLHPLDDRERELFARGREHQRQRQERRDRDRDPAVRQPPPPSSPPRGRPPSPSPALETGAAPAAAAPELARMLYENVLRSVLSRTIPNNPGELQLLDLDLELESKFGWEEEPSQPQDGRAKRPRLGSEGRASSDGGAVGPPPSPPSLDDADGDRRRKNLPPRPAAQGWAPTLPGNGAGSAATSTAPAPVRQTEVHRTVVAQFQDRNTSGTVFGGHLLRLAYEHAATAAAAFAGVPCELLWLEEGAISSPARVGDMLHAVGRVVWAEPGGRALRVVVRVGKYDVASSSQHVLALTLTAAFLAPTPMAAGGGGDEDGTVGLREVVPSTLAEAGEALAALRRHEDALAALAAVEAAEGASAAGHDR